MENTTNKTVSNSYRRIEHHEVYQIFKNALDKRGIEYTFNTKRLGTKNTTVGFRFILTGMTKTIHGDEVHPAIVGRNSLNGESSLNFRGGTYRFCCANQLCLGKDIFIGRIIHRAGETFEEKIKQLDYQIAAFLDEIEVIYGKVEEATNQELNIFQMNGILEKLKVPKMVKKEVRSLIVNAELRREEDRANNVWTLWNMVNEVMKAKCKPSSFEKHNENLMSNCVALAKAA